MRALLLSSLAIALAIAIVRVDASPSCMTMREARAKYPRDHLYWHGPARCWDNQRGRTRHRMGKKPPVPAYGAVRLPVAAVALAPRGPLLITPVPLDILLRFLPWDLRIAGTF
jgi:hypothetical protein